MKQLKQLFAIFFLMSPLTVSAAIISTNWQSIINSQTGAVGDLGGIAVNISNLGFAKLDSAIDLSSSNYSVAPLTSSEEMISHSHNAEWSVNFDKAINNLLLYVYFYRGPSIGSGNDPATYTYTFDSSFSILSGLGNAVVSGNDLTLSTNSYGFGIIKFDGTLSSLSVTSTTATNGNLHSMTFGLDTAVQDVPEPDTIALMILGIIGVGIARRKKVTS